jgi:hypothetical protein
MRGNIEQEWKGRLMPEARELYDTLPRHTGSTLVRMVAAQFVTERAIFCEQGGQYSLRTEKGYALEPISATSHTDMMGVDEHVWRVLERTPPHLEHLVSGINRCLAECSGNEALKHVVQRLFAR